MHGSLLEEVDALRTAPFEKVRARYQELFQEEPRSRHRESLVRRIAWRLHANIEGGGLSERARKRALEIANDADVRFLPPRGMGRLSYGFGSSRFDRRIPPVGTVLTREYRGRTLSVTVLARGFDYEGRLYGSLSAIATEITKTRWNGLAFFGLTRRPTKVERHATR